MYSGVARRCQNMPHPQSALAGRVDPSGQDLAGVLPAADSQREARVAAFPRASSLHRFTDTQADNTQDDPGARRENRLHVLLKIGCVALRWSRPLEGPPKTETLSHEDDGWDICCWCADAAVPVESLPEPGPETGIDRGSASCATLSDRTGTHNPCCDRKAARRLKTAPRHPARRNKAQIGDNRGAIAARLQAGGEVTGESVSDGEAPTAGLPP
jgi:hypothetical protein